VGAVVVKAALADRVDTVVVRVAGRAVALEDLVVAQVKADLAMLVRTAASRPGLNALLQSNTIVAGGVVHVLRRLWARRMHHTRVHRNP
jgi:hypothetical protein